MLHGVIRLRATIERGLRNPWLRPVLIILLALMLGLLVLHSASDQNQLGTQGGPLVACLALAFLLAALLAPKTPINLVRTRRLTPRAPPCQAGPLVAAVLTPMPAPPLRL